VLTAAEKLFAARGPAAVSARDIAKAAGVNYGLIHRYFGTKDAVLVETIQRLRARIGKAEDVVADEQTIAANLLDLQEEFTAYTRTLAWALLAGADPRELLGNFPAIDNMVRELGGQSEDESDRLEAKVVAGAVTSLVLGWRLFEPFILTATGLDAADPAHVRAVLAQVVAQTEKLPSGRPVPAPRAKRR
jgi:AcrR family transcriptional regulator